MGFTGTEEAGNPDRHPRGKNRILRVIGGRQKSVEKAPEVAPPPKKTSQMHVSLGDTDKISAPTCFVALHDFHNDLPSILSVTSYEKPESEQFPAFMIQGEVEVGSLPALINQAVPVELYVMLSRESPVWHSAPGQPVEVRVTAASEAEVTGEIVSGTLINSETGETKSVTGKFEFVR